MTSHDSLHAGWLISLEFAMDRLVSPSANACNIRRALAPSRPETKLDSLI
jgi:hypothetical protein